MSSVADIMDLAAYAGGRAEQAPLLDPPLPLLSLAELQAEARNIRWLVKGAIPLDSLGLLFGGSGTFKSFVAIDLALHVAHGLPWLGKKTTKGPVIIIAAEGGAGLWRRIVAWHRHHNLRWSGAEVYVVPVAVDLGAEASRVREAATAIGVTPALVVIDTMAQTFGGEENSAGEVSHYLREIGLQIRSAYQCAVLVVHHTGHMATERPRGSSALRSNVDFMFGCFRDEKEMLATVECHKQKDGELCAEASFALSVVELGKDEDGDAITSLVAARVGDTTEVLDLMRHEASRGRGGHKNLFLELAYNGAEEKKVRAAFADAIEGDAEAKRKGYYRARKWAMEAGIVEIAEGFVLRRDSKKS